MGVPNVQIKQNDQKVEVFWETDISGVYPRFKLYYDTVVGMGGATAFSTVFSNYASSIYSDRHIFYTFNRSTVGVDVNTGFYLRLNGVKSGGGEDAGAIRYVPALDELAAMEDVSKLYGYDSTSGVWRRVAVDATGKLDTV